MTAKHMEHYLNVFDVITNFIDMASQQEDRNYARDLVEKARAFKKALPVLNGSGTEVALEIDTEQRSLRTVLFNCFDDGTPTGEKTESFIPDTSNPRFDEVRLAHLLNAMYGYGPASMRVKDARIIIQFLTK